MLSKSLRAALLLLAIPFAAVLNASTPVVNSSGQLTGATGVNVNGSFYDVTFAEGSCNSLFGGCDPGLFTFHDQTSALAAAQALLDQVFLDVPAGNFGSNPTLTFGCLSPIECESLIPFHIDSPTLFIAAGPFNFISDVFDFTHGGYVLSKALDTVDYDNFTFALFTPVVPGVPEPATWLMMLFGFGAIGTTLRRRKRSAKALLQTN